MIVQNDHDDDDVVVVEGDCFRRHSSYHPMRPRLISIVENNHNHKDKKK